MFSCSPVIKLQDSLKKKMHFQLNLVERLQLFMHTSMCDACKAYEKQNKDLDSMLDKHVHTQHNSKDSVKEILSEDVKNQILKKLKE